MRLLAREVPAKAGRIAAILGVDDVADAVAGLIASLGLPTTLGAAGYHGATAESVVAAMIASPFNRTSPYAPTADEYRAIVTAIAT